MPTHRPGPAGWRMPAPCVGCPFNRKTAAGRRQWAALRPARRREILDGLLGRGRYRYNPTYFLCHETTGLGRGRARNTNLLCAGAIALQERRGTVSQYQQVCERLDYFRALREGKRHEGGQAATTAEDRAEDPVPAPRRVRRLRAGKAARAEGPPPPAPAAGLEP